MNSMNNIYTIISLIIAAISLIVSIVALIQSSKAQKLQNKNNEIDIKLKQEQLKELELHKNKSCVEARVYKESSNSWRLNIWNSGDLPAYDVDVLIEESADISVWDNGKLPFKVLEPKKNFEVALLTHMASSGQFNVQTKWSTGTGEKKDKNQMCAL